MCQLCVAAPLHSYLMYPYVKMNSRCTHLCMRRWTDGPDGWMDGLQHVEYARMIVHIDFSQTAEAQRETLEAPDSKKFMGSWWFMDLWSQKIQWACFANATLGLATLWEQPPLVKLLCRCSKPSKFSNHAKPVGMKHACTRCSPSKSKTLASQTSHEADLPKDEDLPLVRRTCKRHS